ncbi:MAG: ABC transporter substrate-binding protein [Desulfamplus sp.]|nr:ABC transporter substrate-binding protein [Desulfamplus sp.]
MEKLLAFNKVSTAIFTILTLFIVWLPPSVLLSADTEAEIVLRNGVNSIIDVLNDPAFADKSHKEAKRDISLSKAEAFFDFKEFSRGALGQNWRQFSSGQQSEFTKYFSQLIANTYIARLDGESLNDIKITYLKTEIIDATKSGIERAEISTEVFHNKIATPVHYRMMKKKGESWKIYDVKIEGVSLVGNYREQYRTRFNDPPDKFIQEIKEKIAQ